MAVSSPVIPRLSPNRPVLVFSKCLTGKPPDMSLSHKPGSVSRSKPSHKSIDSRHNTHSNLNACYANYQWLIIDGLALSPTWFMGQAHMLVISSSAMSHRAFGPQTSFRSLQPKAPWVDTAG